jgi:hypothetical protein
MGKKKGKMSTPAGDGQFSRKWMKSEMYRNLDNYVDQARKEAYDKKLMDKKFHEQSLAARPRMTFPYLDYLINQRIQLDNRGLRPANSQPFHLGNDDIAKRHQERFRRKLLDYSRSYLRSMNDSFLRVRQGGRNDVSPLQLLCLQNIAHNLSIYTENHLMLVLSHLTPDLLSQFNSYCCYYNSVSSTSMALFARFPLQTVYFRCQTTNLVTDYLDLLRDNSYQDFRHEEDWESIDVSSLTYVNRTKCLTNVIFYNSKAISISVLPCLSEHLPNLIELSFINTQLIDKDHSNCSDMDEAETSRRKTEQTGEGNICSQLLMFIASGLFPSLRKLSIVYCTWAVYSSFHDFLFSFLLHASVEFPLTIHLVCLVSQENVAASQDQTKQWKQLCSDYETLTSITLDRACVYE